MLGTMRGRVRILFMNLSQSEWPESTRGLPATVTFAEKYKKVKPRELQMINFS